MGKKKLSQKTLTIGTAGLVLVALTYTFWPQPILVDIGEVSQGYMQVSISEEANTQVNELYVVSAPINGRLLRVELEPGDSVIQSETIVARILPNPLSSREREQAQAAIQAASASVEFAKASLRSADANKEVATQSLQRAKKQLDIGTISESEFETIQANFDTTYAFWESETSTLAIRKAELRNAQAVLSGSDFSNTEGDIISITAPISGQILRVLQKNETVLAAGTDILEIGNLSYGLELLVELLSSDAVKVKKGQQVIVDNWGGTPSLTGIVSRIEPNAFVKTSALGVEERRVNAIIQLLDLPESASALGHGYRVEASIIVWEKDDATIVPSSALFRENGQWSVFVIRNNRAHLQRVTVEENNGTNASILAGLAPSDQVILYPAAELADGSSVSQR